MMRCEGLSWREAHACGGKHSRQWPSEGGHAQEDNLELKETGVLENHERRPDKTRSALAGGQELWSAMWR